MKGKKLSYFGLIVLAFPGFFTASAQTFVQSDLLSAPSLFPNFGHDEGVTTLNFQATVLAGMHKQIAAWGSQNAEVEIELVDLDLGISLGTWPSEPPVILARKRLQIKTGSPISGFLSPNCPATSDPMSCIWGLSQSCTLKI